MPIRRDRLGRFASTGAMRSRVRSNMRRGQRQATDVIAMAGMAGKAGGSIVRSKARKAQRTMQTASRAARRYGMKLR